MVPDPNDLAGLAATIHQMNERERLIVLRNVFQLGVLAGYVEETKNIKTYLRHIQSLTRNSLG
jgi:hypothetical protein